MGLFFPLFRHLVTLFFLLQQWLKFDKNLHFKIFLMIRGLHDDMV